MREKRQAANPKKTIGIAIATLAGAVILTTGISFAYERLRPLRIGAYDLIGTDISATRALLAVKELVGRRHYRVEELDPAATLDSQLAGRKKPDLVLCYIGAALAEAAPRFASIPDTIAGRLPSAIRDAAATSGRRYGLALQADHFEFAYSGSAFAKKGLPLPSTLAGLAATARRLSEPKAWPIIVAGGDDLSLLLLITALIESEGGSTASEGLRKALAAEGTLRETIDIPLRNGSGSGVLTLRTILDGLVAWRNEGLLHPEWFRMKTEDVAAFMGRDMAPIVLMTLSQHRAMPVAKIRDYGGAAFPAGNEGSDRAIAAPLLAAAALERSPRRKDSLELLAVLTSQEGQKKLCDATGLAPASASAEALDLQATNARLWIAASQGALPDIGRASKATGAARSALAAEIRQYLEAGGAGF